MEWKEPELRSSGGSLESLICHICNVGIIIVKTPQDRNEDLVRWRLKAISTVHGTQEDLRNGSCYYDIMLCDLIW